ncbi:MAG: Smr/MutS family protein [Pseudomonadota bacterium]|nr:Smr/MutS family protein [Pseudomonadota bacterium]
MSEKDKSLFLKAMQGVVPLDTVEKRPLYDSNSISQTQKEVIKQVKRKAKANQHSLNSHEPKQFDRSYHVKPVTAFENLLYHRKGLRLQELSKLKKGEFAVQAILDLHGYTQDEAELQTIAFVNDCYQNKYRYVRIIHGKGYNSEDNFPILKNLVNQILRQKEQVLAFTSTPQKDGGTGAVNMFLKAQYPCLYKPLTLL